MITTKNVFRRCIYNALSDIKPEVENVIKMGRKLVEGAEENGLENAEEVTKKIDSLKEDFNETGAQVQIPTLTVPILFFNAIHEFPRSPRARRPWSARWRWPRTCRPTSRSPSCG